MNTFPRNSAGAGAGWQSGASAGALGARATGALDAALGASSEALDAALDARATGAALGASSEALDAALDANVGAVDSHAADKISAAGHCASGDCASGHCASGDCASGDCASEAADTAAPLLEVRHVSKAFGHKPVLQDLCLELYPGEIVSILGISGSGKSTLFNIIAGLIAPDEGQILLRGHDVTGKRGHVAYMLQKDLLLPHLTILDNVALPLLIRGSSNGARAGFDDAGVVLDATDPVEALRLRPDRLAVISKGRVVAEKARNDARLSLDGRPAAVRRRHAAGGGAVAAG